MKFFYKAIKATGEVYEGEMDASDKAEVFQSIASSGGSLISAEATASRGRAFINKINSYFGKVKTQEKILFARNLSAMTEAGLSISRALGVMTKQSKNQFFKKTITDLSENIKKGKSLSDAMKERPDVFNNLFVSVVRAGEESGDLSKSLKEIANQTEKAHLLRKKITGAMIYPAVILSVMAIIGVIMLIYVVPTLTSTYKELKIDLPITTQFIILTSDFLSNHTILFLFIVAVVIALLITFFRSKFGHNFSDFIILKIPLIGSLARESNSAKTTRTLSSLLLSGVDVVSAINITKDVINNHYYKEALTEAANSVQKGLTLSDVLSKYENIYPVFVAEMAAVGEETGKLSEMLERVASYYEDEVDQRTKNMSTIIEPVLMVVIGVVVGFFAVSMILPMYSLVDAIG